MLRNNQKRPFDAGFFLLLLLVLSLGYYAIFASGGADTIYYSEARQLFVQERVRSFQIYDTTLTMDVRAVDGGGSSVRQTRLYSVDLFWEDLGPLIQEQQAAGILTYYQLDPPYEPPWWLQFLVYGLLLAGDRKSVV